MPRKSKTTTASPAHKSRTAKEVIDPMHARAELAAIEFAIDPTLLRMRLTMALGGILMIAEHRGEIAISPDSIGYFEKGFALLNVPVRKVSSLDDLSAALGFLTLNFAMEDPNFSLEEMISGFMPGMPTGYTRRPKNSSLREPANHLPAAAWTVKVHLDESSPLIWRRLILPNSATMFELHRAIQKAFGWTDTHLHLFIVNGETFGGDDDDDYDESEVRLFQLNVRKGSKFEYVYDFGDDWRHVIKIEAIDKTKTDSELQIIDGEGARPPEDSGGVWGYYQKLQALKDPSHPCHHDAVEWLGEDWSTEYSPDAGKTRQLSLIRDN